VHLRAAGEQALEEIDRLERQLSLYRSDSELADINRRAAREPVKVTPRLFRLLAQAKKASEQTGGAFDITVAPLVRCWGFMGGTGKMPSSERVAAARELVGMHLLELNESAMTVRFLKEGVMLDLGAIGKGYAIDHAAECLRDAGVTSALLHGGTSSIYAIGKPTDAECWKVAIENPSTPNEPPVATVALNDESLSVSAVWGRSFVADGKQYGHVIDPRTGQPTSAALLSAIVLPSATEADALSTALLTLGRQGLKLMRDKYPQARALVLFADGGKIISETIGEWEQ
jgi:thiamine biosynthesis lipoprotein